MRTCRQQSWPEVALELGKCWLEWGEKDILPVPKSLLIALMGHIKMLHIWVMFGWLHNIQYLSMVTFINITAHSDYVIMDLEGLFAPTSLNICEHHSEQKNTIKINRKAFLKVLPWKRKNSVNSVNCSRSSELSSEKLSKSKSQNFSITSSEQAGLSLLLQST